MKDEDRDYLRKAIALTAFTIAFGLYGYLAAVYVQPPIVFALPTAVGLAIGLGLEAVRRRL